MKTKHYLKWMALMLTVAVAVTGVTDNYFLLLSRAQNSQEEAQQPKEDMTEPPQGSEEPEQLEKPEDMEEQEPEKPDQPENSEDIEEPEQEPEKPDQPENPEDIEEPEQEPEEPSQPENSEDIEDSAEKPENGDELEDIKQPEQSEESDDNQQKQLEKPLKNSRKAPEKTAEEEKEITPEEAFAVMVQEADLLAIVNGIETLGVYQEPTYESAQKMTIPSGYQVKLTDVVLTEGGIWYQVSFGVNDKENTGYLPENSIVTADNRLLEWKNTYLGMGRARGVTRGATNLSAFPASYRPYIQNLLNAHPNWTFIPMNTNLSWSEVIKEEMVNSRNLLQEGAPLTWLSTAEEDYKFDKGEWIWDVKNGGNWFQASESIVRFYMDPRNFLNEISAFQFEQLSYNSSIHNEAGVEAMLKGIFMSHKPLEDGSGGTYAQVFMQIGRALNVSPYMLASRVRQEQGEGNSPLISGTVAGYAGYYNYFNIQATGTGNDVVISGMNEAVSNGWNTRYKALNGGAKKVAENYISKGQDTLYLQKFDVDNSYHGMYWHQYMQNLMAADSESKLVRSGYQSMGTINNGFVFKVPVYKNMPAQACPAPGENLGTPSLKASKNGYTSVKLSWSESLGAQSYEVYRSTSKSGKYTRIATLKGLGRTTYEDKKVEPGKRYYYKVRGFMNYNGGRKRSAFSAIKGIDYSIPTTSLTKASAKNYTTIDLAWKKVSVSGYRIYRKTDSGSYKAIKTIKGSATTTYQDKTLEPNHTYTYKIRGYKTVGGKNYYASYSPEKKVSTKIAAGQMEAVSSSGGNRAKLTWKRNSKANGYVLYRATKENGSYKKIKTITSNKTVSYTDKGITTGTQYYYKVRSYAKSGKTTKYGAYSNILMASTRLTKPTITSVSASSSVKLKWKKSANAAGYKIYRATSYKGKYKAIKTVTKNTTVSYTDKNVTLGKVYYYKVRAYAKFGKTTKYSSYSAIVCAQPELSETQIASIYSIGTTSLKIKWEKVSDANGYKIYRKTGKKGKYTCVKTITNPKTVAWSNTKLKKGSNYYYKVRAYKKVNGKVNYSSYSSEWSVQTKK